MKNILKIDISTYLIVLLSFLAGNYKEILAIIIIIILHEIGHFILLKIYKKEIISIRIYPFGGITKYNSLINHNIKSELLIASAGIIMQLLLFIIIYILYINNILGNYFYDLLINTNISLILFNLLPIIGLDGEKILHLLLELFIPYKLTNNIVVIISFITLIIFSINCYLIKINSLFLLSFFVYKLIIFIKNKKYIENKFLLERFLYNIPFRKIKYNNKYSDNKLYQDTYHFFDYQKEYDYLKNKYKI